MGTIPVDRGAAVQAVAADLEWTRRVVASLRYGHRSHVLGCPRGCALGVHEPGCSLTKSIEDITAKIVDYDLSAVFVPTEGGVRLISLRQYAEARR